MKFYMEWREDFDDQYGWFSETELKKVIKRIKRLEKDEDGESCIYLIIEGTERTEDFI